MNDFVRVEVEEEKKITKGLVKVEKNIYEIPRTIFCPDCGYFAEFTRFYSGSGRYDCKGAHCRYSITSDEYVAQELAKAEQEQK